LLNLDLAEPKAPGDYVVINVRSLPRVLGSLHEQDCQTRSLLNQLAAALALDGLRILFYSASADDHLVVQGWAREMPYKDDLRYYWGDFKEFAVITQRARAMITMRMHPGIFAAAFGVPVVAIDNRPKHSDSFQPMGDFVKLLDPVGLTIETLLDFARTAASENQERRRERFTLARQLALRQKAYCKTLAKKLGRVQRHEDPPLPFPDKFEQ
jgi:polysaccharide pyruvyl transferase WcaK-like protein